jgi:hypothetical protein
MAQLQATKQDLIWLDHVEVESQFEPEPLELAHGADVNHARALQQQLLQAYDPSADEQKLPKSRRVAVILGLTCALWAALGISVVTLLNVLS